jgi:hypothetical protein
MPVAKVHVCEGKYDEVRLGKVSSAVEVGLISALDGGLAQRVHISGHAPILPPLRVRRGTMVGGGQRAA